MLCWSLRTWNERLSWAMYCKNGGGGDGGGKLLITHNCRRNASTSLNLHRVQTCACHECSVTCHMSPMRWRVTCHCRTQALTWNLLFLKVTMGPLAMCNRSPPPPPPPTKQRACNPIVISTSTVLVRVLPCSKLRCEGAGGGIQSKMAGASV